MRSALAIRIVLLAALLATGLDPFEAGIARAADAKILESGTLEAADYVALRNEAGRPLPLLYVAEPGTVVKKGDLLAELDVSMLVEAREEQELQVAKATAEQTVAAASLESTKQEANAAIDVARMALDVAQGDLDAYAQGEFPMQVAELRNEIRLAERRLRLVEMRLAQLRGPNPNHEQDEARLAENEAECDRAEAEARIDAAQSRLAFLENTLSRQQKARLQLVVAQRELELRRAQNELRVAVLKGEAALKVAVAAERIASSRMERLDNQIRASKIHAPRDGIVMSPHAIGRGDSGEPALRSGAVVRDRQIILHLADTTRLQLGVEMPLEVAQRITTGQSATIRFDALPDRTFRGRVARMRTVPGGLGGSAAAEVIVSLDEPTKNLKLGMTARIEFDPVQEPDNREPSNR